MILNHISKYISSHSKGIKIYTHTHTQDKSSPLYHVINNILHLTLNKIVSLKACIPT